MPCHGDDVHLAGKTCSFTSLLQPFSQNFWLYQPSMPNVALRSAPSMRSHSSIPPLPRQQYWSESGDSKLCFASGAVACTCCCSCLLRADVAICSGCGFECSVESKRPGAYFLRKILVPHCLPEAHIIWTSPFWVCLCMMFIDAQHQIPTVCTVLLVLDFGKCRAGYC